MSEVMMGGGVSKLQTKSEVLWVFFNPSLIITEQGKWGTCAHTQYRDIPHPREAVWLLTQGCEVSLI